MSAEVLRRAAALMRERAEAADDLETTWGDDMQWLLKERYAVYVATWHPAVALAVADHLELVADRHDGHSIGLALVESATTVANAYLGESA